MIFRTPREVRDVHSRPPCGYPGTCIYLVMPKSQHVKFVLTLNLDIDPHGETDEAIREELEDCVKPYFAAWETFPGISGRVRRTLDQ